MFHVSSFGVLYCTFSLLLQENGNILLISGVAILIAFINSMQLPVIDVRYSLMVAKYLEDQLHEGRAARINGKRSEQFSAKSTKRFCLGVHGQ